MIELSNQYVRVLGGIDGSHWQIDAGPHDLKKVRSVSTDGFLAWKATQAGTYVDPTFRQIRDESGELDFQHRIWYHWISSTQEVQRQVDHYLQTVGKTTAGEGAMLDGEEWDKAAETAKPGITHDRYCEWLEGVEEEKKCPTNVYSGLYVANGTIWRSDRIRNGKYGPRPMTLAAYISRENLLARLTALSVGDLPIHAWQYSSDGPVPGITGRCDMNNIIDPSLFDLACGIELTHPSHPIEQPSWPTVKDSDMSLPIITNKEQYYGNAPGIWKAVMMDDGRLRHIELSEWNARGNLDGTPFTNAELEGAGTWSPSETSAEAVARALSLEMQGTISLTGKAT